MHSYLVMTRSLAKLLLVSALLLPSCRNRHDPEPAIGLSASTFSFTCIEGGANPVDQTVVLTNSGDARSFLEWTATSSAPWLSVSPTSGRLGVLDPMLLTMSVNAATQVEGWIGSTSTVGAIAGTEAPGAVWTGSAMLVWRGDPATPAKFYDPSTDTWFGSASTVGAPSTRLLFSAVWTGTEMIIWGGVTSFCNGPLNTGARYNPSTDTWTPMSVTGAPAARLAHSAVWTGTHMIVWGGDS